MKLAFYISSVINVDSTNGFGHTPVRSAFSAEERFRQTQFTIASIRLLFPESKIFLFEIGHNVDKIRNDLNYVSNLEVVSAEELDPVVTHLCRTNTSKGTCETAATILFLKHYINELKEYDYFIKVSGRYFYTDVDTSVLNQENTNKYISKYTKVWDWLEWWGYPDLLKNNGKLFWTPSTSYAVGRELLDDFNQSLTVMYEYYINNPELAKIIDFECLLYHFVIQNKPCVEVSWILGGWGGQSGQFSEL